jgi:hypothetical protein
MIALSVTDYHFWNSGPGWLKAPANPLQSGTKNHSLAISLPN